MDGEAGSLALPPALLLERGIRALGQFIRRFHDAAATFVPAEDAVYRIGARALGSGEIVCHGDLGYFNMVWQGDEIVGLIDWDLAEPASPLRDLALAAMTSVPMHGDETASRSGFPLPIDRKGRLAAFCAGYGEITPTEVIEAATEMLAEESERLQRFGAEGREPWATFLERGQLKMFELVAFWIAANRDTLV